MASADARHRGILFVISAPSGAGKTSLVRALVHKLANLRVSVSHTTRPRRPGEREGQDYYFVSRDEFRSMIDRQELLEHALVFDHYYGTSKTWVARTLDEGWDVILEIDWQGAAQVREAFPESVSLEVFPPSLPALETRLRQRAQDTDAVIARRMRDAVEEMRHYAEFDYLVVNDDFEVALEEVEAVIRAERVRIGRARYTHAELIDHLLSGPGAPGGTAEPSGTAALRIGAR